MRTSRIIFSSLAGFTMLAMAAAAGADKPGSIEVSGRSRIVNTPDRSVEVTPLTDNIFRVTARPLGSHPVYAKSQSAIMEPDSVAVTTVVSPEALELKTATTTVVVDRKTGEVAFRDAEGNVILGEAGGVDNSADVKTVRLAKKGGENFYGAGERGHSLRLNGDSLRMFNRQNYGYTEGDPRISQMGITVPYYVSDLGYGVLFDDYNDAMLVLGDTVEYISETPKPLSYYFINGEGSIANTTSGYSRLTGMQELPPFWSLGYITSKYGYRTQDEALGAIDTLKRHGYPVDGIVFDLYWYGEETDMGRLAWNTDQWPDHKKMLADLKDKGVNTVIISQPYINKKGAIDNYNEAVAKGLTVRDAEGNNHDVTIWVGESGMWDVSNPATREWYWNRYRSLTEEGVEGWWGDLGEPEVHPLSIVHANGETASQYHNVYGNEWSRIIYDGFKKDFPDKRMMTLMRGGTAGLQRYNVFPWSTDVSRSWGGLQPQVKIMLNSGLSGLGYMSSDLGGFAVDPKHPTDPELYVRWVQMGAFTPTFRTHAQYKPEPYHYPAQEKILLDFVKQRYEWLPYNYTLAYENATMGLPLARPLNFNGENPEEKYADVRDEYLWGDDVLIVPVMTKGARSRKVLFPAGTWVNWNNPLQTYKGGTTATVSAPLSQLPMFVRAGAFIPQYSLPIENVTQYNPAFLDVLYFPSGETTEYTMFEDDRVSTRSLSDGAYLLLNFEGRDAGNEIVVSLSSEGDGYVGMSPSKMMTLKVPGMRKAPREVTLSNGTPVARRQTLAADATGWRYNAADHTLEVRFPWDLSDLTVRLRR